MARSDFPEWLPNLRRRPQEKARAWVETNAEALIDLLDSGSAEVRRAAAELLRLSDDPATAEALIARAWDEDKNVGNAIASALEDLATRYDVVNGFLSDRLQDENPRVRFTCARAWRGGVSELGPLVADPSESVRWAATCAIRIRGYRIRGYRLDEDGVEFLAIALRDAAPTVRLEAIRGLSQLPPRDSFDHLALAVADPDPRVRLYAAHSFARNADARAVEVVRPLLDDRYAGIRFAACEALLRADRATGVEAAIALLGDRKRIVREGAARLLGEARAAEAVEPLIDLLERSTSVRLRAAAARALGEIGDRRAVAALTAALDDDRLDYHYLPPLSVQEKAREALGKITTPDARTRRNGR